MSSVERLKAYYNFDDDVLAMVREAIDRQSGLSFRELADRYGISDGPEHHNLTSKPLETLTFKPKTDYDESRARILHTPFAMPVWQMATRAMRLFEADPTTQLIMVGNPASIGNRYNRLSINGALKVWAGNLKPTVDPHLAYLESIGVTDVEQIGFSWGADKAAEASGDSAIAHGINVLKGVYMEPVSVVDRGIKQLLEDFRAAEPELKTYQAASDMPPIDDAIKSSKDERIEFLRYVGGILRASNIAISHVLAHRSFADRAINALGSQPNLRTTVTIAWGSQSELIPGQAIMEEIEAIRNANETYAQRVGTILLKGMHHAGGDDIDLHAAIVLQCLAN